jgi:hypothetical protein
VNLSELAQRLEAAGWEDWGGTDDPANNIWSRHFALKHVPKGDSYGYITCEVSLQTHTDGTQPMVSINDHGDGRPTDFMWWDGKGDVAERAYRALRRRDPSIKKGPRP